jgi:hypothetical protein
MTRTEALVVTKICALSECQKPFESRLTEARSAVQRFCSRKCHMTEINRERGQEKRRAWDASPQSQCSCGEGRIPYEVRATTKYCSPECRALYGKKKQADPENYLTFTCQGCGETVTRRKSYGKYHKYCSNTCAQRHTKLKRHIVVDEAVVLDSTWEALFWGLCGFRKITVERFARESGVLWKADGWYAPDFWVPSLELAVEVKGIADESDPARWRKFREDRRLAVLGRDELDEAMCTQDLAVYLSGLA